jgi:hypothetical protein
MKALSPTGDEMSRLFAWLANNLDTVTGLLLALTVGVLGMTGQVEQEVVNSAILLILALLAQALLRERWRRDTTERQARQIVQENRDRLTELLPQLRRITADDGVLAQARTAIDTASMVRVLHGADVGHALAEARRQTSWWAFKGGTGTFTRAVTLPDSIEQARLRHGTLDFAVEIIDPTDEAVCERYARFRQSLSREPDATGERWTVDRTRKESFATVLAACWHLQRSGLLKIDVRLSTHLTTLRFDLSSACVIITQEDPRAPALRIDCGETYYNRYKIELQYSREQSRRVPIEQAYQVRLDDEPGVEQTRKLFEALEVPLPRSFGDREVSEIVAKAIQPRNPYG